MIGKISGLSAMNVCIGKSDFYEFLTGSKFYEEILIDEDEGEFAEDYLENTQLAGVKLEEFGAFLKNGNGYDNMIFNSKCCYTLMETLIANRQAENFIHLGPSFRFQTEEITKNGLVNLSIMNSVEVDPLLSSFWVAAASS